MKIISDILQEIANRQVPFMFENELDTMANFQVDVLALSCYAYRIGSEYLFSENSAVIKECDYELAGKIRKYYRDKLMLSSLKGEKLSKFRQDLNEFLNSEKTLTVSDRLIGMVCRLPSFYMYDTEIERLFGGKYKTLNSPKLVVENADQELQFKTRLRYKVGRINSHQYWFETTDNDMACLHIPINNPLEKLFYNMVTKNETVTLNVRTMVAKKRDGLNFYDITFWKLAND